MSARKSASRPGAGELHPVRMCWLPLGDSSLSARTISAKARPSRPAADALGLGWSVRLRSRWAAGRSPDRRRGGARGLRDAHHSARALDHRPACAATVRRWPRRAGARRARRRRFGSVARAAAAQGARHPCAENGSRCSYRRDHPSFQARRTRGAVPPLRDSRSAASRARSARKPRSTRAVLVTPGCVSTTSAKSASPTLRVIRTVCIHSYHRYASARRTNRGERALSVHSRRSTPGEKA